MVERRLPNNALTMLIRLAKFEILWRRCDERPKFTRDIPDTSRYLLWWALA
jgi:hypothetical protein